MDGIAAIAVAALVGNVAMRMNKWDLLTLFVSVPMMAINVLFLKPGVQGQDPFSPPSPRLNMPCHAPVPCLLVYAKHGHGGA